MKLESARSLKQELRHDMMLPSLSVLAATAHTVRRRELGGTQPFAAAATAIPPAVIAPLSLGIGITGRQGSYKIAVRVYRATPGVERLVDRIREKTKGEMERRVVGLVRKQAPWHQSRNRPLQIGGSVINAKDDAAGTLGAFVALKTGSNADLILSNNHVLARENDGKKGDTIVQPGRLDGGSASKDVVARLHSFVKMKKSHNLVDAAIAELDEGIEYYYSQLRGIGTLAGVRTTPLAPDETVYKVGRTTGATKGRVSAVEMDDVPVDYNGALGVLEFDNQIEIEPIGSKPFSLGGDSGSLIVDANKKAVGLLYAGNDADATYANPIGEVLTALKIDLVY